MTGKKGTIVWPAMFFGGFKLKLEKITTEKKKSIPKQSAGKMFFGGFKLQPEKITTGKKKSIPTQSTGK
jgi:hypothetical protein